MIMHNVMSKEQPVYPKNDQLVIYLLKLKSSANFNPLNFVLMLAFMTMLPFHEENSFGNTVFYELKITLIFKFLAYGLLQE